MTDTTAEAEDRAQERLDGVTARVYLAAKRFVAVVEHYEFGLNEPGEDTITPGDALGILHELISMQSEAYAEWHAVAFPEENAITEEEIALKVEAFKQIKYPFWKNEDGEYRPVRHDQSEPFPGEIRVELTMDEFEALP